MGNSIESILSSVMGNEDLMNKIRDTVKSKNGDSASSLEDVISLIAPALKESQEDTIEEKKIEEQSIKENELGSFLLTLSNTISKNTDLLIALKPYLNKDRSQMIDGVVKISKLTEALKLL